MYYFALNNFLKHITLFVNSCAVSYDPLHCAGYIPEGHKSSSSPSTSPTQQANRFRRHVKIRHRNSHRAIMHSFEQSAERFNLQIPQIK